MPSWRNRFRIRFRSSYPLRGNVWDLMSTPPERGADLFYFFIQGLDFIKIIDHFGIAKDFRVFLSPCELKNPLSESSKTTEAFTFKPSDFDTELGLVQRFLDLF